VGGAGRRLDWLCGIGGEPPPGAGRKTRPPRNGDPDADDRDPDADDRDPDADARDPGQELPAAQHGHPDADDRDPEQEVEDSLGVSDPDRCGGEQGGGDGGLALQAL
jgi:hypothetical protein